MFIAKNKVRIHDTDMAGLLYYPRQFRFAHDALEDFVESEGFSFNRLFHKFNFLFVVVHCESDYYAPLNLGDLLEVHVSIEKIGHSSFTILYNIYRESDKLEVGTAKTTHVTLETKSRKKIPIPKVLLDILKKHPSPPPPALA